MDTLRSLYSRYALGTDVVQHIRSDDEQNRKIVGHEIPP